MHRSIQIDDRDGGRESAGAGHVDRSSGHRNVKSSTASTIPTIIPFREPPAPPATSSCPRVSGSAQSSSSVLLPRRFSYRRPGPLRACRVDSSAVYRASSVRCSPDTQRGPLRRKPPASRLEHRRR